MAKQKTKKKSTKIKPKTRRRVRKTPAQKSAATEFGDDATWGGEHSPSKIDLTGPPAVKNPIACPYCRHETISYITFFNQGKKLEVRGQCASCLKFCLVVYGFRRVKKGD